ncbi:hypothetical protein [Aurantiacibacter sp. MUD61]|uniref:hypothetical protein n=1 Tax=Aurantiacibacter sp. MUD61 TaxID=3009083 RepID=UPI0022EFE562|nr:hypothetical protein [Aurantiacibacter sp. MUD61]
MAATEIPETEFGFIHEPMGPPAEAWFALISQMLIVCVILALTFAFFMRRRRLAAEARAALLRLRLLQLKYLAALAVLIGASMTGLLVYRALINAAVAGRGMDAALGPLAESLFWVITGVMIAAFGVLCMLLMLWRGRDLMPPDDKTA